jgi:hypothetical protein
MRQSSPNTCECGDGIHMHAQGFDGTECMERNCDCMAFIPER